MIASSFLALQLLPYTKDSVVMPVGRSQPERLVYTPIDMVYTLNQEPIYSALSSIAMIYESGN